MISWVITFIVFLLNVYWMVECIQDKAYTYAVLYGLVVGGLVFLLFDASVFLITGESFVIPRS